MSTIENKADMTIEEWLAVRKEAGLKIDPETAEVCWRYAQVLDPYGVFPECPKENYCIGSVGFARSPESDVWVCLYDLPEATVDALRKKADAMDDDDDWPF